MAAPSGQLKASRYFAVLLAIIAVIYALVFFSGNRKPTPKLGLDLQGGTSMTLSASQSEGTPDAKSMEQAREIIAERVDLTGVNEPEVVVEGTNNIIVNVAGGMDETELRNLVAPAKLLFRKVTASATDIATSSTDTEESASAEATESASAEATDTASAEATDTATAEATDTATAEATDTASAEATDTASAEATESASAEASASETLDTETQAQRDAVIAKLGDYYTYAESLSNPDEVDDDTLQTELQYFTIFEELTPEEIAVLPAEIQYKVPNISCEQLRARPAGSVSDADQTVVACNDVTGSDTKYLLDVAKVVGEDVDSASYANEASEGGWIVQLSFTSDGQDRWTALTEEAYNDGAEEQVAIVLDNEVVSAPAIESVISGDAVISGSFTKDDVQTLARQLKYGSLPLSFDVQSVESVTATIGEQAMYAGLLAGAIGLALVILYCLIYYRALGFVVILSLLVSGTIVYGSLVLLGRSMGFTLGLAGIVGFIVAIGITADSFVVFFERLKDEVKDGRTVRSAVPRAWIRARRTIISADMVSFIAALVLYLLAAGSVKGFAFTLGMSTLFDLVVVFLFTHPLVAVLSRFNTFTSPRFSGLGNMRSDKKIAATRAATRPGRLRTKES